MSRSALRRLLPLMTAVFFTTAVAAMADVPPDPDPLPPRSCVMGGGAVTVDAEGPFYVECTDDPGGVCTQLTYRVSASVSAPFYSLATLVRGSAPLPVPETSVYPLCVGDPFTRLGAGDCSAQAVGLKVSGLSSPYRFHVLVRGRKTGITSTVALRPLVTASGNDPLLACPIIGLSYVPLIDPKAAASTTEYVTFEGCTVVFTKSSVTGAVLSAETVTPGCSPVQINDLSALGMNLPGFGDMGPVTFGEGQISTGLNSCSTRLIGGKLYTVCTGTR